MKVLLAQDYIEAASGSKQGARWNYFIFAIRIVVGLPGDRRACEGGSDKVNNQSFSENDRLAIGNGGGGDRKGGGGR